MSKPLLLIRKIHGQQSGQVLLFALVILLLSSIIVVPLTYFVNTNLNTTRVYGRNTREIYAADTGFQNAQWKILHDPTIVNDRLNNKYNQTYTYPSFTVNHNSVSIVINYLWLLSGIVNITNGSYPHNTWLGMTMGGQASPSGNATTPGTFTISFAYNQSDNKKIAEMGVWLPHGFNYVPGSASRTNFPANIDPLEPVITPAYGGTSLVWNVKNDVGSFSFQNLNPPTATQQFWYLPGNATPTGAAAWAENQSQDIGYTWDNAIWWYDITSTASDNTTPKTTVIRSIIISDNVTDSSPLTELAVVTYALSN